MKLPTNRPGKAWVIVPTLVYAFLTWRELAGAGAIKTAVVAALGAGLWYAQSRPEIPARWRPLLPYLQVLVVFVFLGGNPVAVALVGAGIAAVVHFAGPIVRALEPWWRLQERIPASARRPVGTVLAIAVGYLFGANAGGAEWTMTFLSICVATAVVFLCTFVPPAAMRQAAGRQ
jgi:hypothetical protein